MPSSAIPYSYSVLPMYYFKQSVTLYGISSSGITNGLLRLSKITTASSGLGPPGPSSRHWSP